jgi:hypothetical protein
VGLTTVVASMRHWRYRSSVCMDTMLSIARSYLRSRGQLPELFTTIRPLRDLAALQGCIRSIIPHGDFGHLQPYLVPQLEHPSEPTAPNEYRHARWRAAAAVACHPTFLLHSPFEELGYELIRPITSIGNVLVQQMTMVIVISPILWNRHFLFCLSCWL